MKSKIISKVAILNNPKELIFQNEELDPNNIPPGCFLAKTLYSAISPGTETAAWNGLPPLRNDIDPYPRLVGYCNVAKVIATANDTLIKPGNMVLTFSSHRSYFKANENEILAIIPDNLSPIEACKAYLFHLGYSAVLVANEPPGAKAAVIGQGVLGISSSLFAEMAGWDVISISDKKPIPSKNSNSYKRIVNRNEIDFLHNFKVVIVTTNFWKDWDIALKLACQKGKIIVLGFPGRSEKNIPFNPLRSSDFYHRQLQIIAAGMLPEKENDRGFTYYNEKKNLANILDWFKSERISSEAISSEIKNYSKLPDLYEILSGNNRKVDTYILDWETN